MERLLTPLKRGTKEYLTQALVPVLIDGLTQVSIARPDDPLIYLAEVLIKKSPNKEKYVFCPKEELDRLYTPTLTQDTKVATGSGIQAVRILALSSPPLVESNQNDEKKNDSFLNDYDTPEDDKGKSEETVTRIEPSSNIAAKELETQTSKKYKTNEAEQETEDGNQIENSTTYCIQEIPITKGEVQTMKPHEEVMNQLLDSDIIESENKNVDFPKECKLTFSETEVTTNTSPCVPQQSIEVSEIKTDGEQDKHIAEALPHDLNVRSLRCMYRLSNVTLMILIHVIQNSGELTIDAWNPTSLERYSFSCKGVDFDKLNEENSDRSLIKNILKTLELGNHVEKGTKYLRLKTET